MFIVPQLKCDIIQVQYDMPVCKMASVDYLSRTGCGRLISALFYFPPFIIKFISLF
nr:MAG TPA: hypothetical protein [Caudoviricetes sp.]